MYWTWLLPVAVIRLHVGGLNAVGWGKGPWALVTPVRAIRVGVGDYKRKEKIIPTKWCISLTYIHLLNSIKRTNEEDLDRIF